MKNMLSAVQVWTTEKVEKSEHHASIARMSDVDKPYKADNGIWRREQVIWTTVGYAQDISTPYTMYRMQFWKLNQFRIITAKCPILKILLINYFVARNLHLIDQEALSTE